MADTVALADYRPFHRTSQDTVWDKAFEKRDRCYSAIIAEFSSQGIQALVTKSENGQYPPYIRIEAWRPSPGGKPQDVDSRIRSNMDLLFKALPYHEYTVTATARATIAGKNIAIADRPDFSVADATQWALYTVGARGKPDTYRPVSDFFVNAAMSLIPFTRSRHSNRVERAFRNLFPFSVAGLLVLLGLIFGAAGFGVLQKAYRIDDVVIGFVLFIIAIALIAGAAVLRARRRAIISVIDRPGIPPRYLFILDSWHAAIPDLGPQAESLKAKIAAKLGVLAPSGITTEIERYGFRAPNGYDERDRIVVTKGQGVAHIHVYSFGNDLFVGWDSYANWATWGETKAISTRRQGLSQTEYRGLLSVVYFPSQFDLIDLNALAELVHRDVTTIVKAAMEERKIDQEIDFTIIRGDRDQALDRETYNRRSKNEQGQGSKRRWSVS